MIFPHKHVYPKSFRFWAVHYNFVHAKNSIKKIVNNYFCRRPYIIFNNFRENIYMEWGRASPVAENLFNSIKSSKLKIKSVIIYGLTLV